MQINAQEWNLNQDCGAHLALRQMEIGQLLALAHR
jgi:hypothetical protein